MTPLEVLPREGAGAEVLGVDVSAMTVGEWNQIEAAFAAFGLLVFRDQILTERDHVEFAQRWGAPVPPDRRAHPTEPEIAVRDLTSPSEPGSQSTQGVWYADRSYALRPPLGSVEIAREIPAGGATTIFADTHAAFDTLSSGTQRALEALRAVHTHPVPGGDVEESRHPIVIHHPVSGRKTLFVNPTFTTSVEDMDEREGLGLLNQLYDHCQQPEFLTTVEWELGMVVIWDSRAVWEFSPRATEQPTMHRVTISGTELRPAIAPAKKDPTLTQRAGATLAGGILTAAMTGIAEVIDPERVKHDIEIVSEAPEPDDLPDFDFGELPPLD